MIFKYNFKNVKIILCGRKHSISKELGYYKNYANRYFKNILEIVKKFVLSIFCWNLYTYMPNLYIYPPTKKPSQLSPNF